MAQSTCIMFDASLNNFLAIWLTLPRAADFGIFWGQFISSNCSRMKKIFSSERNFPTGEYVSGSLYVDNFPKSTNAWKQSIKFEIDGT